MKDWENSLLKRGGQSIQNDEPSIEVSLMTQTYLQHAPSCRLSPTHRTRHTSHDQVRFNCAIYSGVHHLTSSLLLVPNVTTLPSLTAAMSRLSGTLSDAQGRHTVHQNDLEAVHAEQSQLDAKENEMRVLVANAETKRAWMSDFSEWMETIATFLDEKVSSICLCRHALRIPNDSSSILVPQIGEARGRASVIIH